MALRATREITAELKICLMKLTRIGDAEGETVETQYRATAPAVGDVIEDGGRKARWRARHPRQLPSSRHRWTFHD
jgi:hypothetical protein